MELLDNGKPVPGNEWRLKSPTIAEARLAYSQQPTGVEVETN
jgi:hypothetical protein